MRYLEQPAPENPLIALGDYRTVSVKVMEKARKISIGFYKISFKTTFHGSIRYGQDKYDFQEGGLAFLKPHQVVFHESDIEVNEGYALFFHPDLIRNHPLGSTIQRYGFFSYEVNEALCLSAREKEIIAEIFGQIARELQQATDRYSKVVLISQIELLLNYSDRFYNKQFITRDIPNRELISKMEKLLHQYFEERKGLESGLPSVGLISHALHVSPRYLSDMLRALTGLNAQQYIQNTLIENAKQKLAATDLSVSEIAFELGFEHPQSFNKLFKKKTNQSPLEFRQSFN